MQLRLYDLAQNERVLFRHVLHSGECRALTLIDASGDKVMITPFDCETANTVFIDKSAIILAGNVCTPAKLAHLTESIQQLPEHDLASINKHIATLGLYYPAGKTPLSTNSIIIFLIENSAQSHL